MNRIHRKVWSAHLGAYVAVAETTRSRGKSAGVAGALVASALLSTGALAQLAPGALPTGGQVQAGTAAIATSGSQTTITQGSDRAAIDWQSFSVGSGASVQFIQPGAGSVALNRVLGADASQIWGSLRANGQIFLINPNGVLFAPGAQVDAAGILASTRDISVGDFMAGRLVFQGTSHGAVVNKGALRAADGGYVVLVGAQVVNEGAISAPSGNVRMAAADKVQLRLDGRSLVTFEIQRGTLDGLVANHGAIQAEGGRVWLTADALDALSQAVVNNTGVIEAQTVADRAGTIVLLGDLQHGQTQVSGRLDASAPDGGPGGFIETSAAKVKIADGTQVLTRSATPGRNGKWLIDPTDFVVAASGGDISGSTLSSNLGSGDIEIMSTQGAGGVTGKVIVNDDVSWSANRLTLNALGDIDINANLDGSGSAQLTLKYGQGEVASGNTSTYTIAEGKRVNLPDGQNLTIRQGSDGSDLNFTVISSLGSGSGSATGTDLQGINGALSGLFALGADIDASDTANWTIVNSVPLGFNPIGNSTDAFTGRLEGLGHTVSDLTIARDPAPNVGLFGVVGEGAVISHLHLTDASISGGVTVGGIAAESSGTVRNVTVAGSISGEVYTGGIVGNNTVAGMVSNAGHGTLTVTGRNGQYGSASIGGLVGFNQGTLSASSASSSLTVTAPDTVYVGGVVGRSSHSLDGLDSAATVSGSVGVGGLVGRMEGDTTLSNSNATGAVTGYERVGGLVGEVGSVALVVDSSASGAVSGSERVGGLVGETSSNVLRGQASGNVTGSAYAIGGLVGFSLGGNVTDSQATGLVDGGNSGVNVGGLVGQMQGGLISGSQVAAPSGAPSGARVTGDVSVGGLVGSIWFGDVTSSHASVDVSGNENVGGLVGENFYTTIDASHATGNVTGATAVGGLLGAGMSVTDSYATGTVSGGDRVGGLVGWEKMGGTVSTSYATGSVTGIGTAAGGLVGYNDGTIGTIHNISQMPSGQLVVGVNDVGGLVGLNASEVINSQAAAAVTGSGANVGGLIGRMSGGSVNGSGSSSVVISDSAGYFNDINIGGLIGRLEGGTVDGATASGAVSHSGSGTYLYNFGGLVGEMTGGTLQNSSSSSAVTGQYGVGGAIGTAQADISLNGVSASGAVTAASTAGGFIGRNSASFDAATNTTTSTVTSSGGNTGGYFGSLLGGAEVTNVSVSNAVTSTGTGSSLDVGGVVGYLSEGLLDNVTASNTVTVAAGGRVGGIAGKNQINGTIRNATFSGTVSALDNVGGLVGANTGAFINGTMSGTVTGTGTTTGGAFGTFDTAQGQASFSNVTVSGTVSGHDNVGGLIGQNSGYLNGSNFTVSSAVTASGSVAGGYVGTNAVQGTVSNVIASNAVTSTLNGVGALARAGGVVGHNQGTVQDAGATAAVQAAASEAGGVVGFNDGGTVTRAYATGVVASSGGDAVGGLVGTNTGEISIAFASGAVSGVNAVGGLVGAQSAGSITDAYATGAASGTNQIGGLVGHATGGTATRTYASGAVTGSGADVGGFAGAVNGAVNGAVVSDSFYNTTTSGRSRSVGQGTEVATGKTAAQMQEATTYAAWGSNIATTGGAGRTWRLYEGLAQPLLMHWLAPLSASTSGTFSYTNDGSVRTDAVQASYADTARPGRVLGTARYNAGPADGIYTDVSGLYSSQFGWDISYAHTGTLTIFAPGFSNVQAGNTPSTSYGVSVPNVPSGAGLSGPLGDRSAAQSWTAGAAALAEGGTGAPGAVSGNTSSDAVRSVVSTNTREALDLRRAFSIGDGGIRLPRDAQAGDKEAN